MQARSWRNHNVLRQILALTCHAIPASLVAVFNSVCALIQFRFVVPDRHQRRVHITSRFGIVWDVCR